ncbi:MAG: histidine triad nucleotide-binding protein [Betaproteobacteria bacterium]|nr:histidine triad nucleotide-binding protein [Betaproteobacteria bacterium]
MSDCIFCRIVEGEIPAQKVFEDDEILAFKDIHPIAPVHILVIPKRHIESLDASVESDANVFGRMLVKAGPIAREVGAHDGFRTIINTGRIGRQEVYHLHMHIIGGGDPLPAMIKY